MFYYGTAPAANVATNGTPNTETDHLQILTGSSRQAVVNAFYVIGKGAGLTAISGIAFRWRRFTTPSTAGSAITPQPRDPGAQAATVTAVTGPTAGTTIKHQLAIGCGAAGPGGWTAPNPDSQILLGAGGGANGNVDMFSASGTASLNFEYTIEHAE